MFDLEQIKIAVIGLGYVGLPLAVAFGKRYPCVGFDINPARVCELQSGWDATLEVDAEELAQASLLQVTNDAAMIADCNVYIVTVPTPIDRYKQPDLAPLINASNIVGAVLKKNDVVIYESTVYPGATEEECVPVLESQSRLIFNQDFFVGYSPERINPGDKVHRLSNIAKVTSGSTAASADFIDRLYRSIIPAGTHKVSGIRVAEAAKVIENVQRDVNIALINELALLFNRLAIDTEEVLQASASKWNFLPFKPGLVGGHCIGVDPYYLTYKAQSIGYNPQIILSGRRINDDMGRYVVSQVVKLMLKKQIQVLHAKILIMGLTFKENCPDVRNSGVIDIIDEFKDYDVQIDVYDPWIDAEKCSLEYDIVPVKDLVTGRYDAIILAVAHEQFKQMTAAQFRALGKETAVIYDIKYLLPAEQTDGRL